MEGWADPYSRRALTLGEVGCTLSHVLAWKKVVATNKTTLVLEEDAKPIAELLPYWPEVLQDLDRIDFDICYFAQRNPPRPKPLAGRFTHYVDYHPVWTLAYLITPVGAAKLLGGPWKNQLIPADELLPAGFGQSLSLIHI